MDDGASGASAYPNAARRPLTFATVMTLTARTFDLDDTQLTAFAPGPGEDLARNLDTRARAGTKR